MRQTYTPNRSSEQAFKNALNNDLGVYHFNNQTGFGIGGFLKKMFKQVVPIGKSLLRSGIELAKPELQKLAVKGIEKGANYGVRKLGNAISTDKINKNAKKPKYGTLS
jgi:hypothetical protein